MKIYFTEENKQEYINCVNDIIDSSQWTEGNYTKVFEQLCADHFGMHSIAVSSGGAALYMLYKYANVEGKDVIVPGNTFCATAAAARLAGANVTYADCNRNDLCLSYEDLIRKVTDNTAAVTVVHIAGHIAFDIDKIAAFCKERNIALIEDCAHAHGAEWNGKKAGSWGIGGAYSFYATKTITTGEGGIVVTKDNALARWCRLQRNYGKKATDGKVEYQQVDAFNFRISEFTAALGCIQMKNLPDILEYKRSLAQKYDEIFPNRVVFPVGMKSGYYKYVVFDEKLKEETGKVFAGNDQCSTVYDTDTRLPNCEWVGEHHSCPPIYCGWEHADWNAEKLSVILKGNEGEK